LISSTTPQLSSGVSQSNMREVQSHRRYDTIKNDIPPTPKILREPD
jgi:hypothetical protein